MKYLKRIDLIKRIDSMITILEENQHIEDEDPISFIEFESEDECLEFYLEYFNWYEIINEDDCPKVIRTKVILAEGGDIELNITFQTSSQAKKFCKKFSEKCGCSRGRRGLNSRGEIP